MLYLVPSIIVNNNTLELSEATEGMLVFENELPKSFGNELRRWQTMWQSEEKELPSNFQRELGTRDVTRMLFQPSIVFFSLHAPYQTVVWKLSGPFRS